MGSFNYSAVLGLIYPNASFPYLPAAGSGMYTRDRALTLGPLGNYAGLANAAFFVHGKDFCYLLKSTFRNDVPKAVLLGWSVGL